MKKIRTILALVLAFSMILTLPARTRAAAGPEEISEDAAISAVKTETAETGEQTPAEPAETPEAPADPAKETPADPAADAQAEPAKPSQVPAEVSEVPDAPAIVDLPAVILPPELDILAKRDITTRTLTVTISWSGDIPADFSYPEAVVLVMEVSADGENWSVYQGESPFQVTAGAGNQDRTASRQRDQRSNGALVID